MWWDRILGVNLTIGGRRHQHCGGPGLPFEPARITPRATWFDYRNSVETGEYDFTEETGEKRGDLTITRRFDILIEALISRIIPIPPLSPIDDNTRGILQRIASDDKPLRLVGEFYSPTLSRCAHRFPAARWPSLQRLRRSGTEGQG